MVDTIFEGFQEQSTHKISEEPRRFIEVDNRDAVMVGDLETDSEAIKVGQAQSQQSDLDATIREVVDELTLRTVEVDTSIDTPRWDTADGSHRLWTRIGMQSPRLLAETSRERYGNTCSASLWI